MAFLHEVLLLHYGCSSALEAISDRFAGTLCAAGRQHTLLIKFSDIGTVFGRRIHSGASSFEVSKIAKCGRAFHGRRGDEPDLWRKSRVGTQAGRYFGETCSAAWYSGFL